MKIKQKLDKCFEHKPFTYSIDELALSYGKGVRVVVEFKHDPALGGCFIVSEDATLKDIRKIADECIDLIVDRNQKEIVMGMLTALEKCKCVMR